MELTTAVHRLGGISDRRELLTLVARRELEKGVRSGSVVKAARNLYALPAADEAAVAARRLHGVVSHLSAALAWGWKVKSPPPQPTITVPRNRHPETDSGVDVRYAALPDTEVVDGRTSRVRTAVDCARALPFDEAPWSTQPSVPGPCGARISWPPLRQVRGPGGRGRVVGVPWPPRGFPPRHPPIHRHGAPVLARGAVPLRGRDGAAGLRAAGAGRPGPRTRQ